DAMRVVDLLVDVPDFGPQPRLLEEARRNPPQRVALLDHIGVRMVGAQLGTRGVGGERDQKTRAQRKQFLKHDRQSPDPPRVWPSVPERPASASKNFTFGDGVFETTERITPLLGYAG